MHHFTYDLEGKRKYENDGKRRRKLKGRLAHSLTSWCRNSASISLEIGHRICVGVVQIASRLFTHRAGGTISDKKYVGTAGRDGSECKR
jgi:hypothetical protein